MAVGVSYTNTYTDALNNRHTYNSKINYINLFAVKYFKLYEFSLPKYKFTFI